MLEPQEDPSKKFFTYLIRGEDRIGPFEVRRRFNEFFLVRETILKRWLGLYVPPVPEKKAVGNKDTRFLEDRRRGLDYFARRMATIKYLYYADEFQTFLRSQNCEKTLQTLPPMVPSFLRDKYMQIFGEVLKQARSVSVDYHTKVTNFTAYLKNSQKNLKVIKSTVLDLAEARRIFLENFVIYSQILMPEYEGNILGDYTPELEGRLIFNDESDLTVFIKELLQFNTSYSGYELIADVFRNEENENEALARTLEDRASIEREKRKYEDKRRSAQAELTKLMAGKTTLKSFFSKGSREDQSRTLEKDIEQCERDIAASQELLDIVTVIFTEL